MKDVIGRGKIIRTDGGVTYRGTLPFDDGDVVYMIREDDFMRSVEIK